MRAMEKSRRSNQFGTGRSGAPKLCVAWSSSWVHCLANRNAARSRCASKWKRIAEIMIRLISYSSEANSKVPAYLLIPKKALLSGKKLPAILALHPTDMEYGHRVLVEQLRPQYRTYANEL